MKASPCVLVRTDGFEPADVRALIAALETAGVRAAPTGTPHVHALLADARCALLIVAVGRDELPCVRDAIRDARGTGAPYLPVLGYFPAGVAGLPDDALLSFDDLRAPPFNAASLCLAARRLLLLEAAGAATIRTDGDGDLIEAHGIVARAPALLRILRTLPRIAASDAPVLLCGETGTGKEVCARAIHRLSSRARRPFIAVNCGAIPPELFENEMFGHTPGAFTDARQIGRGLVAEADSGTLFLDEVDALPMAAQVKLLRFLQDGSYKPLGASQHRPASVRVLAATNNDLQGKLARSEFRMDLFYRLNVITVALPPLRERREEIVPLAREFARRGARDYDRPVPALAPSAIHALMCHTWPGNVRELENVIRAAVVLAPDGIIQAGDLPLPFAHVSLSHGRQPLFKTAKRQAVATFEYAYLMDILQACGGNISRAAREAGKQRRAFFELLRKYGLTQGKASARDTRSFRVQPSDKNVLSKGAANRPSPRGSVAAHRTI